MPAEKSVDHDEGSLGFLVNNLVKNWEKEASYKVKGSKYLSVAFAWSLAYIRCILVHTMAARPFDHHMLSGACCSDMSAIWHMACIYVHVALCVFMQSAMWSICRRSQPAWTRHQCCSTLELSFVTSKLRRCSRRVIQRVYQQSTTNCLLQGSGAPLCRRSTASHAMEGRSTQWMTC